MKLPAPRIAALSLTLVLTAHAQAPFTDPANLRGERVQPKSGRELPIDQGALGLQQLLRKLNTRASLMLIVAHPDDEDGGMLTYFSRGLGVRVADLSLTRGEGGQNAMTGDFEDALGLIRTQELLSADRYSGTDQFFGTEVDFGFSKTKEEAFRKWTHDRVLYDAVRAVRLYRPLVIAAVFAGSVTDGHGQHQVSGQIAQEVFKAAADPNVFPELTREGILPWAPLKVYARVPSFAITDKGLFDYATNQYVQPGFTNYVTGQTTTSPPTPDVVIHEGRTDPLLTNAAANPADVREKNPDSNEMLSYVQFARIGLGLQRTQIGPGVRLASPGAYDVGYHLYGSRLCGDSHNALSSKACIPPAAAAPPDRAGAPEIGFFGGIDTSLEGIGTLTVTPCPPLQRLLHELTQEIQAARNQFDPKRPSDIAPQLAEALQKLDATIQMVQEVQLGVPYAKENVLHELRVKRVQLNDALALSLNVHVDATTQHPDLLERSPQAVHLSATQLPDERPAWPSIESSNHRSLRTSAQLNLQHDTHHPPPSELDAQAPGELLTTITQPYFYRESPEQAVYTLRDPSLRNAPVTPPPLVAWDHYSFRGTAFDIGRVLHSGEQPIQIVPAASLSLASHAEAIPEGTRSTHLYAELNPPNTSVTPTIAVPAGWHVHTDTSAHLSPGKTAFVVEVPATQAAPIVAKASAHLPNGEEIGTGYRVIGYGDLPRTNFFVPATTRIVPVDLKLPTHRRIAYLAGTGDAVADNLRSIGFEVSNLTVSDLTPEHLSQFDTIILGVRTYNAHPDLHGAPTQALFDFARNGGNVIVQYQTAEFAAADAPYPITLGNAEKVVDETTPVRLLAAAAPALIYPNRITPADFNNWVEERGHGFLHTWDSHYTALTETHDPGAPAEHIAPQLPQEGGLITTSLGKGHWTYVAFALYRQLPEAVPGAYRLLTNLMALADTKP